MDLKRFIGAVGAASPRVGAGCLVSMAVCAALWLTGCGGGSSSSSLSSTSARSASAHRSTPPDARLAAAAIRRIDSICRKAETGEDQNVIAQFANRGLSIVSPMVLRALGVAARDVARESAKVSRAARNRSARVFALPTALATEAQVLRDASTVRAAHSDEQRLLSVLHQRFAVAHASHVVSCSGPAPNTIRANAPTS